MRREKYADGAIEALLTESRADDPSVRWEAAKELGEVDLPESLDALATALQDDHPFVRWEAAQSLGRVGARLHGEGPRTTRSRALRSSLGANAVFERVEHQAQSPNPAHRMAACDAFGELRQSSGAAVLLDLLKDEDHEVRASAALALGKLGQEGTVPPLTDALRDSELSVRCAAADALGAIGGPAGITALLLWLNDNTPLFRARVVAALGSAGLGVSSVNRALIELLGDDRAEIRWQAARALGRAGNPSAVPHLKELVTDDAVVFGVAIGELAEESAQSISRRHPGLRGFLLKVLSALSGTLRVAKRP